MIALTIPDAAHACHVVISTLRCDIDAGRLSLEKDDRVDTEKLREAGYTLYSMPVMYEIPAPPYSSADLQAIEVALCLPAHTFATVHVELPRPTAAREKSPTCSPFTVILAPLPDALQAAAQWYLWYIHPTHSLLRLAGQKEALTNLTCRAARLLHAAQDFHKALEELDPASFYLLWRQGQHPAKTLEEVQRITDNAKSWADEAVCSLPGLQNLVAAALASVGNDQGHRPRIPALQLFIQRLCAIYVCATGRRPAISRGVGPLWRFVTACLIPLAPAWCAKEKDEALYKHICSVVRKPPPRKRREEASTEKKGGMAKT